MKKSPPSLEQVKELEKELATVTGKLSAYVPRSFYWKMLKEKQQKLAEQLKDMGKKIKIQL